ncbi:hypothetical protein EJ06DRAFT_250755 [Trichodelitschia bisporula]|uniref:Altered inheritance of mitochondria protein 21 n=1 Tax=Trichodelitschia bisporula TaxID=703511 RepID=A0A6G1HJL9_9PEZI|nr:hypothetical protein EJ06DRAFT_250755 [Trichodelitschia bisporula]
MAAPEIPQRPVRSQNTQNSPAEMPRVPPRPKRNVERSISPNRDSFARSPLNDPSFIPKSRNSGGSSLHEVTSNDLPPRPPSVSLPSVGQEGTEYAYVHHEEAPSEHTKAVAGDLPLHAPKASLPVAAAKSRIATVTRTDSTQAAAAGIGKPTTEVAEIGHSLARSTSSQPSRPSSLYRVDTHENEQGIPEIGLQVPMYPNAGDVQAPTPSPSAQSFMPISGTASPRHHTRTRSGREVFAGPPGSYGMHGHGVIKRDPLEAAWYSRHPEAKARESAGEYGPAISDRQSYALSSDQLNKLVRERTMRGIDTHEAVGTPDEQIGYLAAEDFAHRLATPGQHRAASVSDSSLVRVVTPEDEDENVIHVDPPSWNRAESAAGDEGSIRYSLEEESEQPILAADEIAYRPEAQFLQPAVEPPIDPDSDQRRSSIHFDDSFRSSKPPSRSNSVHALPSLARFPTHEDEGTPLDDVKEYEPLFPDDVAERNTRSAPPAASQKSEKLRRPDLHPRHHFPSRDVWEDVPDSLLYETTVATPQFPDDSLRAAEHEPKEIFDDVEGEKESSKAKESEEKPDLKRGFNKELAAETRRPNLRHRFPSRDVWEDTPDAHMHTTTVDGAGTETAEDDKHAVAETNAGLASAPPHVPARPARRSKQAPTTSTSEKTEEKTEEKPSVVSAAAGKLASVKGDFLSALNSRLAVGPKPLEKKEEPEAPKEETPLGDARKGRARGPARRKPAASPAAAAVTEEEEKEGPQFVITGSLGGWEVLGDEVRVVGKGTQAEEKGEANEAAVEKNAGLPAVVQPEADADAGLDARADAETIKKDAMEIETRAGEEAMAERKEEAKEVVENHEVQVA